LKEDVQAGVHSGHLLKIAHESLHAFVLHQQFYEPLLDQLPPIIQELGSSFVTLYHCGQLRGCIGSTEGRYPLALDVARNAAAAARDPRFPPVLPQDLPEIRLEVTVLRPPQLLVYDNYKDLLGKLRPGIDGVIISWKKRRALLLPQVWGRIPESAGFLHALCHKAQIPHGLLWAVPPPVRVMTFEALTYKENDDSTIERK
jgi:AmmeMemoRadiSam system protein A